MLYKLLGKRERGFNLHAEMSLNHLSPAESKLEAAWQVKEKPQEGKELRTSKEMARFLRWSEWYEKKKVCIASKSENL